MSTHEKKPKRTVRNLPFEEKLKLIKRVNRGEKMGSLAEEYGIGRTTIHDIYKNRAKYEAMSEAKLFKLSKKFTLRTGRNPELEEALYEWYLQEKKTGSQVSSTILFDRAKELYREMHNKEGKLSKTFLTGFKRRYGIKFNSRDDDPVDFEVDVEAPELSNFKDNFFKKILEMKLCPSQVYIVTENELCWKVIQDQGFGITKDRITFLACANASGLHKLKLLVMGTSNKSKEFGNLSLPVHYFGQKIARATETTFKTWFYECFVTEVRHWLGDHNLPQKALLLVDGVIRTNEEMEYSTEDQWITAMFYPTEIRDVMPLDPILINDVKQRYKRHLLLTATSRDCIEDTMTNYRMVDMFFSLTESWNWISASKISHSWKRIWENMILNMDYDSQEENEEDDQTMLRNVASDLMIPVDELNRWFEGDEDALDQDELIISTENENRSVIPLPEIVPTEDAIKCFDKCIIWAEQAQTTSEEIALLRKLRDKALLNKRSNLLFMRSGESGMS